MRSPVLVVLPDSSTIRYMQRIKINNALMYNVIRGAETLACILALAHRRWKMDVRRMKMAITASWIASEASVKIRPSVWCDPFVLERKDTPIPFKPSTSADREPKVDRTRPGSRGEKYGT